MYEGSNTRKLKDMNICDFVLSLRSYRETILGCDIDIEPIYNYDEYLKKCNEEYYTKEFNSYLYRVACERPNYKNIIEYMYKQDFYTLNKIKVERLKDIFCFSRDSFSYDEICVITKLLSLSQYEEYDEIKNNILDLIQKETKTNEELSDSIKTNKKYNRICSFVLFVGSAIVLFNNDSATSIGFVIAFIIMIMTFSNNFLKLISKNGKVKV